MPQVQGQPAQGFAGPSSGGSAPVGQRGAGTPRAGGEPQYAQGAPQPQFEQGVRGQPAGQPAAPAGGAAPPRQAGAPPRLQAVTVEDVVQTDVVTAERDTPVATVVAMMAEEDVGSVVIVEDEVPVGIVTDRTVALALKEMPDVSRRQVDEILVEGVVTGTTEMTVFKAVRRMREESIRRLPVVDEDGTLMGIVTLDDVLVLLGEELHNATSIIREQSPRM